MFFGDLTFHPGSEHRPLCPCAVLHPAARLLPGEPCPVPVALGGAFPAPRTAHTPVLLICSFQEPHHGSSVAWGLGSGITFILPYFWPLLPPGRLILPTFT